MNFKWPQFLSHPSSRSEWAVGYTVGVESVLREARKLGHTAQWSSYSIETNSMTVMSEESTMVDVDELERIFREEK